MTYKEQAQEWHQQWFSERKLRLEADARLAELERENEALRKDAERYRWLRDQHTVRWDEKCPDDANDRWFVTAWQGNTVGCLEGELDTEIDAAMEASRAD